MRYKSTFTMVVLLTSFLGVSSQGQPTSVLIEGGSFVPIYGSEDVLVALEDFKMDVYPVTNDDFLQFVKEHSEWQKSNVKRLFADKSYLSGWDSDLTYANSLPNSPVTNVSWYAAKAYCESKGQRLPAVDEWEYAAMADQKQKDARKDSTYNQYILSWYETPKTYTNEIGKTFKNYWGLYDMHGLVWEWTMDFNSVMISGESRGDADLDRNLFCAGGAVGATDLMNYAAFMRYAFRGSLKASYTGKNLGFRCAETVNTKTQ
ncbi:Putative signal peptide protein [Fulvivirga imtechensis AK7]|uniref:Putative signal peptide protein n=1 Tax=Fulvivirga imtechensis AK7 TaxID=1237149 RepID=L8JU01_9BACT|nr:formylglycine-generating enzyme family protein [Fulvivirga imtechensis]ELR70767.1 Putative signal peptide protein [Fulvivirga imtechensis AK7]